MATTADEYLLTRGVAPSNRLYMQHTLWRSEWGWNLHPAAKAKWSGDEPRYMADVATGNGIWLIEEARELPAGSKAYGFDISTAQFPSADTLQDNVSFVALDMRGSIPSEFQNMFDIVHIRCVGGAVYDNDPRPVLKNLISMLKPGGMLQWGEIAPMAVTLNQGSSQSQTSGGANIMAALIHRLNRAPFPWEQHWSFHLAAIFKEFELEDIQTFSIENPRPGMEKFWSDNCTQALQEIATGPRVGAEYLSDLVKEQEQDYYWWSKPWISIGWKPVQQ